MFLRMFLGFDLKTATVPGFNGRQEVRAWYSSAGGRGGNAVKAAE